MGSFDAFFHRTEPARDKYLSRLFGLFSEKVVHTWCACAQAPYEDLGRPTLYDTDRGSRHTLDFTLRHRRSGKTYASEMKCELELANYRYLTLVDSAQVEHHKQSQAFSKVLALANGTKAFDVRCQGESMPVDGAILVWGAVTPDGRAAVMSEYGFADVLSVEAMVSDLQAWAPAAWSKLIQRYRTWTVELFDFLAGPIAPAAPATASEESIR